MTMSAASMKSRIETNISAITPVQGSGAAAANAYRDSVLQAMCQGIISEIQANAVGTGVDPQGGTVTSTIA